MKNIQGELFGWGNNNFGQVGADTKNNLEKYNFFNVLL